MNKKSVKKREFILSKSKQVFIRKGFAAVTMKDIVEECKISRGGIYLYFSSVDEIFMQVILEHNNKKLKEANDKIKESKNFKEAIDCYFDKQKNRLMNIDNSLLMAMHEYRFSHKDETDKNFYYNQMLNTKTIILNLLEHGVKQDEIKDNNIEHMAMNIMFFIEGISTMSLTTIVTEQIIDSQINYIKSIIFR